MGRLIPGVDIIGELKRKSLFGYVSPHSDEYQIEVIRMVADEVSGHVDPRWGGSFEHLRWLRNIFPDIPLIAKGVNPRDSDVVEAIRAGADWVLVVLGFEGRWTLPRVYLDRCIIEPMTLVELANLPQTISRVAWNSRDLQTGGEKGIDFSIARKLWPNGYMIQASNIRKKEDIRPGANGVLVGTHLPGLADSLGVAI